MSSLVLQRNPQQKARPFPRQSHHKSSNTYKAAKSNHAILESLGEKLRRKAWYLTVAALCTRRQSSSTVTWTWVSPCKVIFYHKFTVDACPCGVDGRLLVKLKKVYPGLFVRLVLSPLQANQVFHQLKLLMLEVFKAGWSKTLWYHLDAVSNA